MTVRGWNHRKWLGVGILLLMTLAYSIARAEEKAQPTAIKANARPMFNPLRPKSRPFIDLPQSVPTHVSTTPALIPIGPIPKKYLKPPTEATPETLLIPQGEAGDNDDYDEEDLDVKGRGVPQPAFAKPPADGPVSLVSHSATNVEVDAGNQVVLEARPVKTTDRVRWYREEELLCETPVCTMSTQTWGVGRHHIVLMIFNNSSLMQVFYDIKVTMATLEAESKNVTPPLVDFIKADVMVNPTDLVIRALGAMAYWHSDTDAAVVGHLPQPFPWPKSMLQTDQKGVISLGRTWEEQHYILPSSNVLTDNHKGIRVLRVKSGRVRSRHLGTRSPKWSIVGEDWLQLDTDAAGDVVLEYLPTPDENDVVRINNLRGFARILYRLPPKTKPEPDRIHYLEEQLPWARGMIREIKGGLMITMPPSTSLTLTRKKYTPPVFRTVASLAVGDVLRTTTPEYLKEDVWQNPGRSRTDASFDVMRDQLMPLMIMPRPKPRADVMAPMAMARLEQSDPLLALEMLLPYAGEIPKNYDLALLTGMAYRQLGQYDRAVRYFDLARARDPDRTEPLYQKAVIEMERGRWNRARRQLWLIRFSDPREQEREYYNGVARYQIGDKLLGDRHFIYSQWAETDPLMGRSTEEFIRRREEEERIVLFYRGTGLWNSNVLRQSPKIPMPETLPHRSSLGNEMLAEAKLKLFQEPAASIWASYRFENRSWMYQELTALGWERHTTALELNGVISRDFGGKKQEVRLAPYLQASAIGPTRVQVGYGLMAEWYHDAWPLSPQISLDMGRFSDPDPTNDDYLDPYTFEVVDPIDLSSQRQGVSGQVQAFHQGRQTWSLFGKWRDTRYLQPEAIAHSFTEREIGLLQQYRPAFRWFVDNKVGIMLRDYDQYSPARTDGILTLRSSLTWRIMPELAGSLWLQYDKSKSNQWEHSYDMQTVGGSVELSF